MTKDLQKRVILEELPTLFHSNSNGWGLFLLRVIELDRHARGS